MTIGNVSSSQNFQAVNAQKRGGQFRQDFDDLSQALQSGDLSGAQTAFASIEQMRPDNNVTQATSANSATQPVNGPLRADMDALSKALKSGDLKGAQDAFKQLQQDAQAVRQSRPHHHHHATAAQTPVDDTTDPNEATSVAGYSVANDGGSDSVTSGGIINLSA
jgi:soluble cytochrome b562